MAINPTIAKFWFKVADMIQPNPMHSMAKVRVGDDI